MQQQPQPQSRSDGALWRRSLGSAGWVAAGTLSTQAIRMVRMLVLTWFLAPDQMGLWVLLMSVYGLLTEFSDTGVKHALIQNPRGNESAYLQAGWWLNVFRSGVLLLALYLAAPWIARGYSERFPVEQMQDLLRGCCVIIFFDGLSSIGLVALRKEMRFRRLMILQVIANLIGMVAAIALAWRTASALALVAGEIAGTLVLTMGSYLIHSFRPRWVFDREAIKDLVHFGVAAYGVSLVDALATRLDVLLLGLIGSSVLVGQYGLAVALIFVPCFFLTQISLNVGFPALSAIQSDRPRLQRGVTRILLLGGMLALGIFTTLFLLAGDLVRLLPEKYADVGPALRWLSLSGLGISLRRMITPVFYAIGQVHWGMRRGVNQTGSYVILLVPFFDRWSLPGACWAHALSNVAANLFLLVLLLRLLKWRAYDFFRAMAPLLGWAMVVGSGLVVGWLAARLVGWEALGLRLCQFAAVAVVYTILGIRMAGRFTVSNQSAE